MLGAGAMFFEPREMKGWKEAPNHEGVDNFIIIIKHLLGAKRTPDLQHVVQAPSF